MPVPRFSIADEAAVGGEQIISADSHMAEPLDLWETRLPQTFRDRALRFPKLKLYETNHHLRAGGWDPDERLKDLAFDGISAEVLYPTLAKQAWLLGAQYSLPWSAALALCRNVSDPMSWSEGDLADPEISRLAELMELRESEARFGSAGGPVAEITVTVGGKTLAFAAADWKGAPTDPYTYGDMAGKFARYAAPYVSPSRIDEIVNRVASLENETDAAMLAEAIRSDEGRLA